MSLWKKFFVDSTIHIKESKMSTNLIFLQTCSLFESRRIRWFPLRHDTVLIQRHIHKPTIYYTLQCLKWNEKSVPQRADSSVYTWTGFCFWFSVNKCGTNLPAFWYITRSSITIQWQVNNDNPKGAQRSLMVCWWSFTICSGTQAVFSSYLLEEPERLPSTNILPSLNH